MPMFLSLRVMIASSSGNSSPFALRRWRKRAMAGDGQREKRNGEKAAARTPRNQGRRSDRDGRICKGRQRRAVAGETRDAPHDGRHDGGLAGLPLLTIVRHVYLRFTGQWPTARRISSISSKLSMDGACGCLGLNFSFQNRVGCWPVFKSSYGH
jgi:hypothetical protein